MNDVSPAPPPVSRPAWQGAVRYLWMALFMGALILFSVKTGEHYPFSHFPMYGNPNPRPVDYYFLTDDSGQPLPVATLTGDTAPRLKKQINTGLNEWGFANKVRVKTEIPEDVRSRITSGILNQAVRQSQERGTPLPDRVQLWRGDITPSENGYVEHFTLEATN